MGNPLILPAALFMVSS